MKDVIHEILSELHHLLSIATARELRAAANLPSMSAHIRTALKALANEKVATSKWSRSDDVPRPLRRPESPSSPEQTVKWPSDFDTLRRDLERSLAGLSKEQILEHCERSSLHFSVTGKESRDRMLRRLTRLIIALPDQQREEVLSSLLTTHDRQTEGWVEVIRKGR